MEQGEITFGVESQPEMLYRPSLTRRLEKKCALCQTRVGRVSNGRLLNLCGMSMSTFVAPQ